MTLDRFTRLCHDEWLAGRGDVIGLELTPEGYAELCADANASPRSFAANFGKSVNPVTRSSITVTGTSPCDAVIVRKPIGVQWDNALYKRKKETWNEGVPRSGVWPAS